jgi:hypothetical protein
MRHEPDDIDWCNSRKYLGTIVAPGKGIFFCTDQLDVLFRLHKVVFLADIPQLVVSCQLLS